MFSGPRLRIFVIVLTHGVALAGLITGVAVFGHLARDPSLRVPAISALSALLLLGFVWADRFERTCARASADR